MFYNIAVILWKDGLNQLAGVFSPYGEDAETAKKYINRIRKYKPDYQPPEKISKYIANNYRPHNKSKKNSSYYGCYIATAVYGSYDCPQVWTLRRYRDYTLAEKWYGRAFIKVYYAISPALVKWFGNTKWFKNMWKRKLDRMVAGLWAKGIKSTPYKDREWQNF